MQTFAPDLPPTEDLLEALPLGVVLLDAEGRVLFSNAEERRLASRAEPIAGRDLFREVAPYRSAPTEMLALFRATLDGQGTADRDLVVSSADGVDLRLRLRLLPAGGAPRVLLLVDDVSRARSAERALAAALGKAQDEAVRDPLTGLFNRRHVEAILTAELARSRRHGTPLSVLLVDVDHFKSVNDRYGHPAGDQVLVQLARVMSRVVRVGDTCARLGGEEFCIVLPHTDSPKAAHAAERLHRVVRALRLQGESQIRVTVSIGVSTTHGPGDDHPREMRDLLARGDRALYEAKRTGRDRTVVSEAAQGA